MKEYRERADARNSRTGPGAANPSSTQAGSAQSQATATSSTPAYASLAEQYGLADMMFQEPASDDDQSIEQGYQSYTGEPVSPMSTDPIKYWEVRTSSVS